MNIMKYIYYRLVRFYSKTFGIKDSPGFLIHSCYSWGLLIVLTSIYFYFMSLESIILYYIGINIKKVFILLTYIPFAILYLFSERWMGDEKDVYDKLCYKYKNEKLIWFKGFLVLLFVILSLPCYLITLFFCK